jgi:acid phosphatase type 7
MRHLEPMRAAPRLLLSHPTLCLLAALAAGVVVGVLGPIKVVHAADTSLVEGESFATKPAGATIVSDTLFSGGKALKFTADGTASDTVTCSTGCDVVLMARAGHSGGTPSFSVNGSTPQPITTSNQVAPEPYKFMNLPAGSNEIRVTASGTGTGHNAFLDVASFPADGGGGTPSQEAACADGSDNDGDGKTDYPDDLGCLSPTDNDETDPAGGTDPVFVGAGDIASCSSTGDEATAKLLDDIVAKAPSTTTVYTTGDDAYESGTATEFANCYNPTWGRHQGITRPTVGNHEYYSTANASGYFGYFGSILSAVGDTGQGYYSYDLGSWHMIALNSNCSFVGGCASGSTQEQWLKADLDAHSNAACTLAYWHHPRFSSKLSSGGNSSMKPFWDALYAAPNKAEVVLNGHIHNYERFAPQTPTGVADPAQGIREFVVGTGGKSLNTFTKKGVANSQVRLANAYGVLKLTLHPSSYDWQFVTAPGGTVADSGSDVSCHS